MLEIVATIIKIAIIICATAKKKKYSFENVTSANNIFFMINQVALSKIIIALMNGQKHIKKVSTNLIYLFNG